MSRPAHLRFRRWIETEGWSQDQTARELGISQGAVHKILGGGGVSLRVAHVIERRSASWSEGAIRTEEWDAEGLEGHDESPEAA